LITGGAGFIGSQLCDRLISEGCEVVCVDNFFPRRGATSNIFSTTKNFEIVRHDVTFPLYVEVDQIYNLACPASPIHYQCDPVQTTKTWRDQYAVGFTTSYSRMRGAVTKHAMQDRRHLAVIGGNFVRTKVKEK
jgi:NAD(P)-dependent dehydrogenase (short-subunit alcohol dehydrogenase family)